MPGAREGKSLASVTESRLRHSSTHSSPVSALFALSAKEDVHGATASSPGAFG